MSAPAYILRFDDICPEMNWRNWTALEQIFEELDILPLVAVVPDNQDPKLKTEQRVPDFWDRVRAWQKKGWSIGLHGFQHLYETRSSGIMRLNRRSEFAGLALERQREKISAAVEIFRRERVAIQCWIAPGHSFDRVTVKVLAEAGVNTISDGFGRWPYLDENKVLWVPQQLWNRIAPRRRGIWTVCYHVNQWSADDLAAFRADLTRNRSRIANFRKVCEEFKGTRRGLESRLLERWRGIRQWAA